MTGISEEQMRERRKKKTEELMEKGIDPYPPRFRNRRSIADIGKQGNKSRIAGRITAIRNHGKIAFIDLEDSTGSIEIHCSDFDTLYMIGFLATSDLIGVEGIICTSTKNGKIILDAYEIVILSKAIRDLPLKGLADDDFRFRHREIEMAVNKDTRDLFLLRSKIIRCIREYLEDNFYVEVETPILQPVYGGATARPFSTHHNALDNDFYLRISSELYLKRYLVGGFDRVFHIGKVFRNEGISINHSPEFSMVEFFATCVDHNEMKIYTQRLIENIFTKLRFWHEIPSFKFVENLPSDDWPLSRRNKNNPTISEAWELYIDDVEIASCANDLNNPFEQADRWNKNTANLVIDDKDNSDKFEEANPYDQTYIESLEYGMLPTAGVGIGIDRLVMILTKSKSIRETTAFPAMR